jgi:hypothetical protein
MPFRPASFQQVSSVLKQSSENFSKFELGSLKSSKKQEEIKKGKKNLCAKNSEKFRRKEESLL